LYEAGDVREAAVAAARAAGLDGRRARVEADDARSAVGHPGLFFLKWVSPTYTWSNLRIYIFKCQSPSRALDGPRRIVARLGSRGGWVEQGEPETLLPTGTRRQPLWHRYGTYTPLRATFCMEKI
jgi:hypothetical protein